MQSAQEFREFAAEKGLRGIRGEATIEDLRREFGAARWFDFLDVTYLPAAPLFAGLTQPWWVRDDSSRTLPPVTFVCDFDAGLGAEGNHRAAVSALTQEFGAATEHEFNNALKHVWKFDEIELSVWTILREKTRTNPLYERFPQLWDVSRVAIENPWMRELTAGDTTELAAIGGADVLRVPAEWDARRSSLALWERGLMRVTRLGSPGSVAFWRSGEKIGWYIESRAVALERAWTGALVERTILADRGEGDRSTLGVKLRNPFSEAGEWVEMELLVRGGEEMLKQTAGELGAFWGLGVEG